MCISNVPEAETEEALRYVGVESGWTVLDAGCGPGGYLPLLGELVGTSGRIAALDLAPENIALAERLVEEGRCAAAVDLRIGSVLDLPYATATFDCVWCANLATSQRRSSPASWASFAAWRNPVASSR
jgi:ubiquinone/menaquinone biosynthesis C-methylase UbiE